MELNIKKCPFCGGEPTLMSTRGRYGFFAFVQCSFCGSQGKTYSMGKTRDDDWAESSASNNAIKAWNTRVGDADVK